MKLKILLNILFLTLGFSMSFQSVLGQESSDTETMARFSDNDESNNVVKYSHAYFDRYQPLTALDMVRQVPGFVLENNDSIRGMGSALGNLLINDRRPSAKQDQPLEILARIPAELVESIELIRGQIRDIDMQGQSRLINIILIENAKATIQWDAYLRQTIEHGDITPKASFSLSNNWLETDYSFGLSYRRSRVGHNGIEDIVDGLGALSENRILNRETRNTFFTGNFNASRWQGETFIQLNSTFTHVDHRFATLSRRIPQAPGSAARTLNIARNFDEPVFEFGLDLERRLQSDLTGKLIFLISRDYEDAIESQRNFNAGGEETLHRIADTYNVATEGITRLEFDWSGFADHAIQVNLEAVYNLFDGKFSQTDNSGLVPIIINVPGANSKVDELRWDFLFLDNWSLGQFELDYGVGVEASTITQTGDVKNKRSFFFIKPQVVLTYSTQQGQQTRVRVSREVAQLNLEDFISATVFEDNDLALGNPDIRPDTTWITDISHERRIGKNVVIKLTAFHHWVSDVLDLLPLSSIFEAPGNIGDGRRWGMEMESTVPLQWIGLTDARLKLKARWQDSTVVDPVTGESRVFSAVRRSGPNNFFDVENKYAFSIDFRQDFEFARMAWGYIIQDRAERPRYKVNELEIFNEQIEINTFIETTRWFGIKIRLDFENITNFDETRDRTVYIDRRDLSPVSTGEFRNIGGGPRVFLTFSGTY
ncbi:MAG: hypothetical protein ACI9XC_002006 [Gammaproteobacteria bacterium]|jgi:hypothetical protein